MNSVTILGIALGLAMDAFAVAIASGLSLGSPSRRQVFRISWHFGLFQFLMPILGWVSGRKLVLWVAFYDHWVAFLLLAFVGGKMILGSLGESKLDLRTDPTKGFTLVVLSVATSIDAFAVGLSMAFLKVSIWLPSVVIGIVTGALSMLGMTCASCFGKRLGGWAERLGGMILIGIGVHIVASHLGFL